ncbi:hypothetical protein NMG60_11001509 [Bertholletia excelsa]
MSAPPSAALTAAADCGPTAILDVHRDIVGAHILPRLDGASLASAGCTSSQLYSLSAQDHLWTAACLSNWPSTAATPRLRGLIAAFPGGPRAFFAASFPLLLPTSASATITSPPPEELISAVDIHYAGKLIFSKVLETETFTGWFRCSPFRIDLLDPKDAVPTAIRHPDSASACCELAAEMTLSWVLIDPAGRRAANLSSHKPVAVERHWLTGEVQVRFSTVLFGGDKKSPEVEWAVVVTCFGSEVGEMHVGEVSLLVEDMEGNHLSGKDGLIILHRAFEGKRGNKRRDVEARKTYEGYLARKRERREKKLKNESTLDMVCVASGYLFLFSFALYLQLTKQNLFLLFFLLLFSKKILSITRQILKFFSSLFCKR